MFPRFREIMVNENTNDCETSIIYTVGEKEINSLSDEVPSGEKTIDAPMDYGGAD